MTLFQNSVLNKYLKSQHPEELKEKWVLFKTYFHNATIQENIRNSKEEQFQEGFLRELFVKVLGYTLNPEPNFNLTTEYKNVKDSKKADGAIIINNHVKAVIELKGTDTTDLSKVENQAFNYKNNQPECVYVITSNFEKLRFYIDNAIEHLEFNLFNLTEDEFQLLYVCLAHKNIESNVPKQIKDESVSQEDVITKKLYNDYSLFKRELYQNLVKLNPSYDPLELFKKSQKLLDRFLFIFFAEDRSLLPTNLIFRINKEWQQLREMRIEVSLYDRYKIYFNDLNHGAKVSLPAFSQTASAKKEEYQIYAYNGGLFQEDDILNSVKIDDDILFKHTENLSNYDFASEVDVNILGHIFENSLNELDEIKAQLEGQEVEKTKTKRKKDGVFYTPKYITKYIVDNTVGKLCADKKAELQLNEEDYTTDKKRQQKIKQALSEKLNTYRNWLLQITICDPACGSGAFLNQALDFLIAEHRYIDELQAKLFGDALVLSDVEGSILENNLFGVDINEESVEIAKLSLWLRTAQPNRKLSELNNNIKCGNSLIDDVAVAGDKAFNWEQEFPQVFQNAVRDKKYVSVNDRLARKNPFATRDELGNYKDDSWGLYNEFHEPKENYTNTEKKHGFDVVIGNPPYVRVQSLKEHYFDQTVYFEKKFISATGKYDLYALFIEKSNQIINDKGLISFILPHKFLIADFGTGIRKYLSKNKLVDSIIHFGSQIVFQEASTYTCIINLKRNCSNLKFIEINPSEILNYFKFDIINLERLDESPWNLKGGNSNLVIDKILKQMPLKEICEGIYQGLITTGDDIFMLDGKIIGDDFVGYSNEIKEEVIIEAKLMIKVLKGQDIKRNLPLNSNKYVIYPHIKNSKGKTVPIEPKEFEINYPKAYLYLSKFKNDLIDKKIRYKTNPKYWYSLHRSREIEIFEKDYIITPQLQNIPSFTVKETEAVPDAGGYIIVPKNGYDSLTLLSVLNSKLMWFFIKNTSSEYGGGYFYFKTKYLEPFGIPNTIISNLVLKEKQVNQLKNTKELFVIIDGFQDYMFSKLNLNSMTKKLLNWNTLEPKDFLSEIIKVKKTLTITEEAQWLEYFHIQKQKALVIRSKIHATDKEIDQMVYKLYDLTDEEIAIVENS